MAAFSVRNRNVRRRWARAAAGVAAAELLVARGARVTLADSGSDDATAPDALRDLGVRLELGPHRPDLGTSADLVVLSPGRAARAGRDCRRAAGRRARHRRSRTGVALAVRPRGGHHRHQRQIDDDHPDGADAARGRAGRHRGRQSRHRPVDAGGASRGPTRSMSSKSAASSSRPPTRFIRGCRCCSICRPTTWTVTRRSTSTRRPRRGSSGTRRPRTGRWSTRTTRRRSRWRPASPPAVSISRSTRRSRAA